MQAAAQPGASIGRRLLRLAFQDAQSPAEGQQAPAAAVQQGFAADPEAGGGDNEAHQEEKSSAGWVLLRSALGGFCQKSEDEPDGAPGGAVRGERGHERAFQIADTMEQGFARETVADFTTPLRRSSRLWRFRVLRSEDRLRARLVTDGGEFLMYARLSLEARAVQFFLYDPDTEALYDSAAPAFSMGFSADQAEWRLVQERCQSCQFRPPSLSCASRGKQQLALVRHHRYEVGDGVSNAMEVHTPGIYSDGRCVVWCPMLGKPDLDSPHVKSNETLQLLTVMPSWNEQVQSLVLDFAGRQILSSSKNFQVALSRKPQHVVCQFGKLGPTTFGLDFKYPLSVVQAFGMAMSTAFWQ